jgi:predicted nucleic acid-binding protein
VNAGLDTSVVLRLLLGEPAEQAAAAWRLITSAESERRVEVSDLVVGETYFALRHHYGVPDEEVLRTLQDFLQDHRIASTEAALEAISTARAARGGAGFMDRLIHAVYAHDDARLVTFDLAASKLPGAMLIATRT